MAAFELTVIIWLISEVVSCPPAAKVPACCLSYTASITYSLISEAATMGWPPTLTVLSVARSSTYTDQVPPLPATAAVTAEDTSDIRFSSATVVRSGAGAALRSKVSCTGRCSCFDDAVDDDADAVASESDAEATGDVLACDAPRPLCAYIHPPTPITKAAIRINPTTLPVARVSLLCLVCRATVTDPMSCQHWPAPGSSGPRPPTAPDIG